MCEMNRRSNSTYRPNSAGQFSAFRAFHARRFGRTTPMNRSPLTEAPTKKVTEEKMDEEEMPQAVVNVSSKDIVKLLECPVCYSICLPPITLCANGHFVCAHCRESLRECPLCRKSFTGVRNHLAEELAEKCTVRCKYSNNGCQESLPCNEMVGHYEQCDFRPYLCWICDKLIDYIHFIPHLRNEKLLMDVYENENDYLVAGFTIEDEDTLGEVARFWDPIWFVRNDKHFFCFLYFVDSKFWLWVSLFGNEQDCKDLDWCVKLVNSDNSLKHLNTPQYSYRGVIHPLRTPMEDVIESRKCFIVELSDLKKFMYKQGVDLIIRINEIITID